MKYLKFSIIFCILFMCFGDSVSATEQPLTITAEAFSEDEGIVVYINVEEKVKLDAFTFAILYDEELLEIKDEAGGGYGYDKSFEEAYKSGMMLSNSVDGEVIFSGVNNQEEFNGYHGTVAYACFKEKKNEVSAVTFQLQIRALSVDGKEYNANEINQIFTFERKSKVGDSSSDEAVIHKETADKIESEKKESQKEESQNIESEKSESQKNESNKSSDATSLPEEEAATSPKVKEENNNHKTDNPKINVQETNNQQTNNPNFNNKEMNDSDESRMTLEKYMDNVFLKLQILVVMLIMLGVFVAVRYFVIKKRSEKNEVK